MKATVGNAREAAALEQLRVLSNVSQAVSTTLDLAPVYTYAPEGADLTERAEPERVTSLRVGADYFRVLGVQPVAGQTFDRTYERADASVEWQTTRTWTLSATGSYARARQLREWPMAYGWRALISATWAPLPQTLSR